MKIQSLFFIPLLLLFVFLTGCASSTDPADAYPGQSPKYIFQKGEEALRKKKITAKQPNVSKHWMCNILLNV